jgi:hypothetical protein
MGPFFLVGSPFLKILFNMSGKSHMNDFLI